MSETYRYTGRPYSTFDGAYAHFFSAANAISVTIKTPAALPSGLAFGDPLPQGTLVSIGDGSRQYDDVAPSNSGDVTLSVQLSTGPGGDITAWKIDLKDDGFEIEGPPKTTSYEMLTQSALPGGEASKDQSTASVEPSPVWSSGSTDLAGKWSHP